MVAAYTLNELKTLLAGYQAPPYRAEQLIKALYKGAAGYEQTSLPKALIAHLQPNLPFISTKVLKCLNAEGSAKLALKLNDEQVVESVLLRHEGRNTACLSSQAGCAMGCTFCKTATLGFKRNLESYEIIEQFLHLQQLAPINNIVFMGMGEPLLNLDNVLKTITALSNPQTLGLSKRRFTLSTVGLIKPIYQLAESGYQLNLAFSLISAQQAKRELLIPQAKPNPLPQLKEALMYYQQQTKGRLTFEVVLIPGHNDSADDAKAIAAFAAGFKCLINVIAWNKVEGLPYRSPDSRQLANFINRLSGYGLTVKQRRRMGRGVNGACGQLG